jgi:hypothetical protein
MSDHVFDPGPETRAVRCANCDSETQAAWTDGRCGRLLRCVRCRTIRAVIPHRLTVADLTEAERKQVERQMRPGILSDQGFLAPGERLADVVARDDARLAELGVPHAQIGDRLRSVVARARLGVESDPVRFEDMSEHFAEPGHGVSVDDLEVWHIEWMGLQECPFFVLDSPEGLPGCGSTSIDFAVRRAGTDETLFFSGLLVHLVREHEFFEGSTGYRLDPAQAVRVLDVRRDVDYAADADRAERELEVILSRRYEEWMRRRPRATRD